MAVKFNVLYKTNNNFFISCKTARKVKICVQTNCILFSVSISRSAVLSNGNTYGTLCILLKFRLAKITLICFRFFSQNYQVICDEVSLIIILH